MLSIRELAKNSTMKSALTLCKDATFIPAEKLDWRPEDHGKSVNEILSECAKGNMMLSACLRGEGAAEELEAADFEALKSCVIASAEQLCGVIDAMSDSALEGDVAMPWGPIYPAAEAIFLPSAHMNYHDGQINYIQLLLGDTKFHWAEE